MGQGARRWWSNAATCRAPGSRYMTLYVARIRYFESNPPGPGWDGAFRPVLK